MGGGYNDRKGFKLQMLVVFLMKVRIEGVHVFLYTQRERERQTHRHTHTPTYTHIHRHTPTHPPTHTHTVGEKETLKDQQKGREREK